MKHVPEEPCRPLSTAETRWRDRRMNAAKCVGRSSAEALSVRIKLSLHLQHGIACREVNWQCEGQSGWDLYKRSPRMVALLILHLSQCRLRENSRDRRAR